MGTYGECRGLFYQERHSSFAHVEDPCTKDEDKHMCREGEEGEANMVTNKQKTTAAELVGALRSAFGIAEEENRKEARAYRAKTEKGRDAGEILP